MLAGDFWQETGGGDRKTPKFGPVPFVPEAEPQTFTSVFTGVVYPGSININRPVHFFL